MVINILVFIESFSGWVEAFPIKKDTSKVMAKKILEEILPRFRSYIMLIDPSVQDR